MIAYVAALACAGAGGFLAWHHAIAPSIALAVLGAATAASFVWPRLWLLALPALIPVASFAPWTGSMLVEEIDLLALAFAAGAYARMPAPRAGQPRDAGERVSSSHLSIVAVVLVLLFALSTAVSLHRGVVDAGGWQLGCARQDHPSRDDVVERRER